MGAFIEVPSKLNSSKFVKLMPFRTRTETLGEETSANVDHNDVYPKNV